MSKPIINMTASVLDRLRVVARERNQPFEHWSGTCWNACSIV